MKKVLSVLLITMFSIGGIVLAQTVTNQMSRDCKSVVITDPNGTNAIYTKSDIQSRIIGAQNDLKRLAQASQIDDITIDQFTPVNAEFANCVVNNSSN